MVIYQIYLEYHAPKWYRKSLKKLVGIELLKKFRVLQDPRASQKSAIESYAEPI
jgi:hypothetical protein